MFGKLIIQSEIEVLTGMHIGGSSVFSAIGAVDSSVVRDPHTHQPIIPGSSLKGKLRTLLSRSLNDGAPCEITKDCAAVKRLFGCHEPKIILSRLQFSDCFVTAASQERFKNVGLTEIKFENTIDRLKSTATPRQIERVNRGVRFGCAISYTAEQDAEIPEDMQNLAHAMKLLQMDYLGGHGTRGSGRVAFRNIALLDPDGVLSDDMREELQTALKDVERYDVLSV